jgi:transposase
MLLPAHLRIYVALQPVDMRKSHHGLAAIVQNNLQLDPLGDQIVLFVNKRRNLLKMLFFDRSGLALFYKRLEKGTFQMPVAEGGARRIGIDPAQLAMILEGIDLNTAKRRTRYQRNRAAQTDSPP